MDEEKQNETAEKEQDSVPGEKYYEWFGSKLDDLPKKILGYFGK